MFKILELYFAHPSAPGIAAVKKVNAIYQIVLTDLNKKFVINLKDGNGSVTEGESDKADVTFTMKSDDFVGLAGGKVNAQLAFMTGKLKIKGPIGLALKFSPEIFPKIDAKLLTSKNAKEEEIIESIVGGKSKL